MPSLLCVNLDYKIIGGALLKEIEVYLKLFSEEIRILEGFFFLSSYHFFLNKCYDYLKGDKSKSLTLFSSLESLFIISWWVWKQLNKVWVI